MQLFHLNGVLNGPGAKVRDIFVSVESVVTSMLAFVACTYLFLPMI